MKSRPYIRIGALVAAGLTCSSCAHVAKPLYRDDLVEVTEHSTIPILAVHSSTDNEVLTIWGRTFDEVRGLSPYYLRIPGTPLVLFVTGRNFNDGKATVHLANTSTRVIRSFPANDSNIGSNIDMRYNNERITSLSGDTLVIEANFANRKYKYVIDLREPRFVREERDFESAYPPHNMVHEIYEGGKKPTN